MQQLLVKKDNISQTKLVEVSSVDLSDGQARLKIDQFALTANNITYAVAGEMIGYWKFFPVSEDGWGNVPVWGHADVIESKCDGIDPGERLYGYFPMAQELVVTPSRIRPHAFTDKAAHRAQLPDIYNEYIRLSADPEYNPALEDLQSILFPLYATSYVIYDYLIDNDFFGAEQIIFGSASSKTAMGLLQLLHDDKNLSPKVIGLTSSQNKAFMEDRQICDQVVTYDQISIDIVKAPSVYIDMSGNADVRIALHTHLDNQLLLSSSVGISHWDKFRPTKDLPGPKPEMFFAPGQIKKRQKEWGSRVVQKKIHDAWRDLAIKSKNWLVVDRRAGLAKAQTTYAQLLDGKTSPTEGIIIALDEN